MSGNMAGYSCLMRTNDSSDVKIFLNGISFDQSYSSMRFFTLDNTNRIISQGVNINGSEIYEANFDTSAFPDSHNIDSDAQTSVERGSVIQEKSLIVRHWHKRNGFTQIISNNVYESEDANAHYSKLEAEINNCKAALINEFNDTITEI